MNSKIIEIVWSTDVVEKFHRLSIASLTIINVKIKPRNKELDDLVKDKVEYLRERYTLERLKNEALVRAYRDFFWRMGIDPTKRRPAAEALLRRILQGKGLPRILNVVDAYNLASAETLITMSAYDLDKVEPPLIVRFAKKGEEVILIGNRRRVLTGRELVLSDQEGILCVYVHGDVERTKVTSETRNILLVAYGTPGMSVSVLMDSLKKAYEYITKCAGGQLLQVFASRTSYT
ncbi:MAG: hypothetical protein DRN15_03730 [Thermoprotei archaeon]|nr:MAG: hypothetical protein DRM97_04640 [Thermoprotei archaeon]RLF24236.1 MAG: hypothetical protein DRN15_03730 [Thermoprotei archaeon]